jgi:flavin-dependent thymidylate synthase
MTQEVTKYVDEAMFGAAPMKKKGDRVVPQVFLLNATPDPLGSIAAMSKMYKGEVVYDIETVTDDERRSYWEDQMKSHLQAPLESVTFHFMIEGVTRAFTHQLVRQRVGAVYAQESMRFAVKESLADEVALPPSIEPDSPAHEEWVAAMQDIQSAYDDLIALGIPAEDARGLLPHATTTRVHYVTNLRSLLQHAGNRLCTQAQFEWRAVFFEIVRAIARYDKQMYRSPSDLNPSGVKIENCRWQYELIAQGGFVPVCYQLGHCPFNASYDRKCKIRTRVEIMSSKGIPSRDWHAGIRGGLGRDSVDGIQTIEWLADPTAAR